MSVVLQALRHPCFLSICKACDEELDEGEEVYYWVIAQDGSEYDADTPEDACRAFLAAQETK